MKRDIETREDLFSLMEAFYKKLLADDRINFIFTEIAKINMLSHLPVLVDFWDMVLFNSDTYSKNVMKLHMELHQKYPLNKEHFNVWLGYFNETVDELFDGERAVMAKQRAQGIANLMMIKFSVK